MPLIKNDIACMHCAFCRIELSLHKCYSINPTLSATFSSFSGTSSMKIGRPYNFTILKFVITILNFISYYLGE